MLLNILSRLGTGSICRGLASSRTAASSAHSPRPEHSGQPGSLAPARVTRSGPPSINLHSPPRSQQPESRPAVHSGLPRTFKLESQSTGLR